MMGRGRARVTRDRSPSSRAAQFSKTTRRGQRVSSPHFSGFAHEKGPSSRGPVTHGRGLGRLGLLLRGSSFRDQKKERRGSIPRHRRQVERWSKEKGAGEVPANAALMGPA